MQVFLNHKVVPPKDSSIVNAFRPTNENPNLYTCDNIHLMYICTDSFVLCICTNSLSKPRQGKV